MDDANPHLDETTQDLRDRLAIADRRLRRLTYAGIAGLALALSVAIAALAVGLNDDDRGASAALSSVPAPSTRTERGDEPASSASATNPDHERTPQAGTDGRRRSAARAEVAALRRRLTSLRSAQDETERALLAELERVRDEVRRLRSQLAAPAETPPSSDAGTQAPVGDEDRADVPPGQGED